MDHLPKFDGPSLLVGYILCMAANAYREWITQKTEARRQKRMEQS